MEGLINLLHTGGYSCTIANKGEIRTFTQRGVADIYDLLTQEPEFLKVTEKQDCPFVLWIGSRRMIKRKIFEEYIANQYSI